jgi:hypothetical protein
MGKIMDYATQWEAGYDTGRRVALAESEELRAENARLRRMLSEHEPSLGGARIEKQGPTADQPGTGDLVTQGV